ncbi:MAG: response regulator transcription factor [Gemmiger sp.]|nr:response regulator transcription factor [Gemmiger sp.]
MSILVVDDDPDIRTALAIRLGREGYTVCQAGDGLAALDILTCQPIHLILMDVMMPRLDGFSAIMRIREKQNIPILVMSAKTEDSDKVLGLSIGADDYITKPFNMAEVLARVQSHLRRYLTLGGIHGGTNQRQVGRLRFDFVCHTLEADGQPVKLTPTETHILELLMANPGRIFSAEEIYREAWGGQEPYGCENTVMVHIRRIREKIEIDPKEPEYLKVVWGLGYKLEKK